MIDRAFAALVLEEAAQAARDAFHKALGKPARYPWDSLHQDTRNAWKAVVIAVMEKTNRGIA
jgi:hypothetical protein